MHAQTHRLFKDLLALQGHIASPELLDVPTPSAAPAARQGECEPERPSLLESLLWIGGREPIDPREANDAAEHRIVHC